MLTVQMTTPPEASAHEGVPGVDATSPLGEWRDAAPAVRYSAKAVIEARGTCAPTRSTTGLGCELFLTKP